MDLFMGESRNCEGGRAKGGENGLSRGQTQGAQQCAGNTTAGLYCLDQLFIYACLGTEAVFPSGLVIH